MSQRTKQRAQEKRSQRRRQSQTQIIVIVSVVAVVIAGILILLNLPQGGSSVPVTSYAGVTQEIVNDGALGIAIGSKDAPATLVEYSDFSCPHCRDVAATIKLLIDDYVKDGRLRIVYKPVTFVNPQYSVPAARAMICAARQGQGWEMNDQIWGIFVASSPAAYTPSRLAGSARALGLDVEAFNTCFGSADTAQAIQDVMNETQRLGINGTPTFLLNGENLPFTGDAGLLAAISQAVGAPSSTEIPTP